MTKEYFRGRRVVMFSEARIAFEKEIRDNHPKLAMKILVASKELGMADNEMNQGIAVGIVAAEFNIAMHGNYLPKQIEFMYDQLWQKLRSSVAPISDIILPQGSTLQ